MKEQTNKKTLRTFSKVFPHWDNDQKTVPHFSEKKDGTPYALERARNFSNKLLKAGVLPEHIQFLLYHPSQSDYSYQVTIIYFFKKEVK